ncbi:hypothetical protein Aduo_008065 [Ancylostoma duodenale]
MESPPVAFQTSTASKNGIPKKVYNPNGRVKMHVNVVKYWNVDMSWSFSSINSSRPPLSYIKLVEVKAYIKGSGGLYRPYLVKQHTSAGNVRIGLSPELTFDTGCHFYSVEATYSDGTTAFESTDEECHSLLSTSFLVAYSVLFVMVLIAVIGHVVTAGVKKRPEPKMAKKTKRLSAEANPGSADLSE